MTSRPETTGSEETRPPRPPGPTEGSAAADARTPTGVSEPAEARPEAETGPPASAAGTSADSGQQGRETPQERTEPASGAVEQGDSGPVEEAAAGAVEERDSGPVERKAAGAVEESDSGPVEATAAGPVEQQADGPVDQQATAPVVEPPPGRIAPADLPAQEPAGDALVRSDRPGERDEDGSDVPASLLPRDAQAVPPPAPRSAARGRLSHAMRPRATRAQVLAALLCALLGFALVVQARQTQTQGLDQLRQADLVRLLDDVTNSEARAEQEIRTQQATRDRLLSGSDSSEAARQAAQKRLDTLGLLAGTVPASGPGIELEITDPRRQVDASVLLDTLEELRDGGAEVIQIGDARVVAATAFTDEADGVRVDTRLLTPPYRYKVIGDPQTLAKVLQIPGGVLDVLRSKGAEGRVTQPPTVRVDALRAATTPQYARPAPGGTP